MSMHAAINVSTYSFRAEDITSACARVAEGVPGVFRDAVREDAKALCAMLMSLCPGVPWLTLTTEIVGRNSCSRWHQDNYVGRAIITYTGPGTWIVDDKSVCFDKLDSTLSLPTDASNRVIVPNPDSIKKTATNSVLLIKGNSWPGIRGIGVTHKSPDVPKNDKGMPECLRYLLKVDLSITPSGR